MTTGRVPPLVVAGIAKERAGAERVFELAVPSFTVERGEIIAVLGRSGCGKSTFLELIALAAPPTQRVHGRGRFRFEGEDLIALWRRSDRERLAALRARGIGFILQTGALPTFLTVRQNAELSQQLAGREDPGFITTLLRDLELSEVEHAFPETLSVGQRQRAAIVRALAHRPQLIVADEPTGALDPDVAESVMRLLVQTAEGLGSAVVMASHDHDLVKATGIEVVHMAVERHALHDGRKLTRSTVERSA
ncbi:MAG: ATP-binding cassette domain-containing protein [Pseudomonadota bacterium]